MSLPEASEIFEQYLHEMQPELDLVLLPSPEPPTYETPPNGLRLAPVVFVRSVVVESIQPYLDPELCVFHLACMLFLVIVSVVLCRACIVVAPPERTQSGAEDDREPLGRPLGKSPPVVDAQPV